MDTAAALGRMSISLAAVLCLLWLISRWLRRTKAGKIASAGEVTVLTRAAVGHKAGVAVVAVGDRALVLGVTEAAVSLLSDLPLSALAGAGDVREDREVLTIPAEFTLPTQHAVEQPVVGGPVDPRPTAAATPATRAERRAAELAAQAPADDHGDHHGQPALAGSAISPQTWIKAVDVLRERTTRR